MAAPLVHMRRLRQEHLSLVMVVTVITRTTIISMLIPTPQRAWEQGYIVQLQIARSIGEPSEKVVRPDP